MNQKIILKTLILILFLLPVSSKAVVIFEDDFESGNLAHVDSTSGATWMGSNYGLEDLVEITTENSHSGLYSLKFLFAGNSNMADDAWAEERFTFGAPVNEVHIRFYIYFSENYIIRDDPNGADNTKLGVFWGEAYSDPVTMAIEYEVDMKPRFKTKVAGYPNQPVCSGNTGFVSNPLISGTMTSILDMKGQWTAVEYRLKTDTGLGDGAFQMWINGNLEVDAQNISWVGAPCSPGYLLNGYLMGWSNSGFNEDTSVYIDDIVFSDNYIGPIDSGESPSSPTGLNII
ncbi:MAG: hypothetical protein V3574_02755 [Candidatus Moraniibacteriota bacterium]